MTTCKAASWYAPTTSATAIAACALTEHTLSSSCLNQSGYRTVRCCWHASGKADTQLAVAKQAPSRTFDGKSTRQRNAVVFIDQASLTSCSKFTKRRIADWPWRLEECSWQVLSRVHLTLVMTSRHISNMQLPSALTEIVLLP